MEEFNFKIKGGEKITIVLAKFADERDYFEVRALNSNGDLIGYIDFFIYYDENACFLDAIEVEPLYLNTGVGSCMSIIFEKFLLQNYVNRIDGIYFPHGKIGKVLAKKFYNTHGYAIFKNAHLHKRLEKRDYNVPEFIEVRDSIHWAPIALQNKKDSNKKSKTTPVPVEDEYKK